jgi:transposase
MSSGVRPAEDPMETIFPCVAGLDVHKATVVACRRRLAPDGNCTQEVRTFSTMTAGLLELSDWLAGEGGTHVAMESTGVYGKPVFHILEDRFTTWLVNAQHIKRVPGRKTDVKDCEWIAQLLQHGLLHPSFVPPPVIRELRDLTRHRSQLVGEKVRVANRIQKVLEDANIKLASVATDVLGVSGRDMILAIIAGEGSPQSLAQRARGRLKKKIPELRLALQGKGTEHHRFPLRLLMDQRDGLESLIAKVGGRIGETMAPFAREVERLATIPGLDRRTAENLIAAIGADMGQFPSPGHLAAWAGIGPGNNQSGGTSRSGRIRKGSRWLRQTLTPAAWAASHTKASYFSSFDRRLAGRRGKKRALVALAHTILVVVYHVIKGQADYVELGANDLDELEPERLTRYLIKRLERLGHKVRLEPNSDAA